MNFHVWNIIDGAPEYVINDSGLVRRGTEERNYVRTRRTWFRKRKYVNLVVDGKVKRFYIDPLVKRYFGGLK